jgi:hypothetical protein
MSRENYILDPLWITRGSGKLDAELLKYVLLAANKKFRDNLQSGDISGFNEIVFHALNLNNLAVEGTVFNFNLKPIWDDPRLMEIRESLRKLYQIPEDVLEVFKSANYLFISLLIDYLEKILDTIESCDIYAVNEKVHLEKEIFFAINRKNSNGYEIWRLKFDSRIKMGSRLEYIKSATMKEEDEIDKSDLDSDKRLSKMDPKKNTIFLILKKKNTGLVDAANALCSTIAFTRGINMSVPFNPAIMEELYYILIDEQVLPFTIKTWI